MRMENTQSITSVAPICMIPKISKTTFSAYRGISEHVTEVLFYFGILVLYDILEYRNSGFVGIIQLCQYFLKTEILIIFLS